MKNKTFLLISLITSLSLPAFSQTVQEKKESFHRQDGELDPKTQEQLTLVNEMLLEKRSYLSHLYEKSLDLHRSAASEENYKTLLEEISHVKKEIKETEEMWRDETSSLMKQESYALLQQPQATVLQLVMDYGAAEYVFIVPPEIGNLPISINSNLPIPRESWGECLELILAAQGIGIKQLNPYLRELFFFRRDSLGLRCITSDMKELDLLPPSARICFVLSPDSPDPRGVLQFMQKFSNPAQTTLHVIQGELFIISTVESVKELLKLYDFIKVGSGGQDYQLVSLTKITAKEMETILGSAFHLEIGKKGAHDEEGTSLRIIPLTSLSQSLFLFGTRDDVSKALKLVREVESQIEDPSEKTVFWYTVKHSDAEELAEVLSKVYDLLTQVPTKEIKGEKTITDVAKAAEELKSSLIVRPATITPLSNDHHDHKTADGENNFIVDPKTSSIIMVVEQDALPKIKELLKKLDVPKKMVQLEVLLFEKQVNNQNKFGLNLLRLGGAAKPSDTDASGFSWNALGKGITNFLISHSKGSGIPAFDLAYNFLLGQEDVQINASPSVTTINQTPATIAIVDEISINTGIETDKDKATLNSYARAQYGIVIQITPTINAGDDEESEDDEARYITLDTDITFDTPKKNASERPEIARRHIKNHVRIADGQTLILGGLRRKNTQDHKDSIPFLGEIPGLGKLFSNTDLSDDNTEMFVFITPKIIDDPLEEAQRLKFAELRKRPGDMPEFLHELLQAKSREKKKLFEGGLTALFGRYGTFSKSVRESEGEYDGR